MSPGVLGRFAGLMRRGNAGSSGGSNATGNAGDSKSSSKRARVAHSSLVDADLNKDDDSTETPPSSADPKENAGSNGQHSPHLGMDADSGSSSASADISPLNEVSIPSGRSAASGARGASRPGPSGGTVRGSSQLTGRDLEARQMEEKDFIRCKDTAEAGAWYLVDGKWLTQWKEFVMRNGSMPGPIDNSRLIDRKTGFPKPGLRPVDDYRGVNSEIWHYWVDRYGGGPKIRRKQLDLYGMDVPVNSPTSSRDQEAPGPRSPSYFRQGSTSLAERRRQLEEGKLSKQEPLPPATSQLDARPRGAGRTDEVDDSQSVSSRSSGSSACAAPPSGTRNAAMERPAERRPPKDVSPRTPVRTPSRGRGPERASASVAAPAPKKSSVAGLSFGRASAGGSSRAAERGASAPPARPAIVPTPVPAKKLCCDKCDGPHETDECPHFRKTREPHKDAWVSYGRSKSKEGSASQAVVIVRNARVVQQPGDGSCLFHSLSYGLAEGTNASSLRREICAYISKNPDMTISDTALKDWVKYDSGGGTSVASYAQSMSGSSWGGGIEMAALTRMRNVNVHVYERCRDGYKRISWFEAPSGSRKTVSVLYQGRNHYDGLVVS